MRSLLLLLLLTAAAPAVAQVRPGLPGASGADIQRQRIEEQRLRSAEQAAFARQQALERRLTEREIEAARAPEPASPTTLISLSSRRAPSQDRVDQLLSPSPKTPEPAPADRQAPDAAQDPAELRTTQALNAEITARNELAENQERADRAAFEAERARWEEQQALNNRARLDWEASVRASDEARRRWEADRARWEADVRACQAGDRSRCAPPR
jgi:hypothetical protein